MSYIVSLIDKKDLTVYADIPGATTSSNGSIPPHLCITGQKPDIVIINEKKKEAHLFELTVPFTTRIK